MISLNVPIVLSHEILLSFLSESIFCRMSACHCECISKNYSLFDHQYIAKKETSDSEKLLHNFIINFIVSSVFTHYISNEEKHRYTRFIFLKEGPGTLALSCEVHIFVEGRIRMKLYFEELPFLRKCGPMFCSLLCMQFSSF